MSEKLELKGFAQQGLNTDIVPWDLDIGFLTNMNNVRVINNELVAFGCFKEWATVPLEFNPGFLIHGGTLSSNFWLIAGESAIYSFDGNIWTDISSALGYVPISDKSLWVGDIISKFVVLTHPQIYPEYWDSDSGSNQVQPVQFTPVQTFAAADIRCGIIRSHKEFLIAMDLNEGGTELKDTIRWSDASDVNLMPITWDEADPANLAGKVSLGGKSGRIIDGRSLRDAFVVYRESGITVMDYTGDVFVWNFRHLEDTTGLINKDSIAEVKGVHFFIGDGDIFKNDGNSITSIMHKRIRKRFLSNININEFHKSYVVNNDIAKEIWFCVPEGPESVYPNVAYIYNWKDDTWFIRDLNPEMIFMAYGPELASSPRTWATWSETWATASGVWGNTSRTPLTNNLIGIILRPTELSKLIVIDCNDPDNPETYTSFIERDNMPIEGQVESNMIISLYPHMTGTGTVRIHLGSHKKAGGPISWKPIVNFDPEVDRKVSVRSTGTLHAFRIEGDGKWSFSGMDIEYNYSGKR